MSIALAAFPEIRDRILKRIDQAVNAATDLVNKAAEMLKKGVSAILDFLASTIDKVLGLIQDLYNAVFTIIGMIISGELKEILERLGKLIDAAKTAPGQFETAAYEELLGGNLDQPLSPAELMTAGRTPPASAAAPDVAGGMQTEEGDADGDAPLPGPPWTEDNVGVDAVATGEELSPELSEELLQMTGGGDGEVSFGASEDGSRSLKSIWGIDGQGQTSAPGAQATQGAQGQTGASEHATYTDGLTPRERAGVKWTAMKQGLASWWSQNWPYVLAGGVLAVAGFIVANILTGGAILAALPAIMTAVGYIFAGLMVVQLAGHLRDFLQKGWNGDIQGGGKSLAKGLAAGAIELITLLTFKVGSVALKGAKAAAKGVAKGAQAVARGTANVARGAMRIARRGAQYVLKGGKVLLRGAGQGISRGVKRLRELGARLLQRTRFKGFRIRIQARRFRLDGKINPWVLLATGEVKWEKGPKGGAGSKVNVDSKDAFVLSDRTDHALANFLKTNPDAAHDAFALLNRSDVDPTKLLKSLNGLSPEDTKELLRQLRQLKEVDELDLRRAIDEYRASIGIKKTFNPNTRKWEGGTVGAGKAEFGHFDVDGVFTGASTKAQDIRPPQHNRRYEYPGKDNRGGQQFTDHAEQTILGDIANRLDAAYKGVPREQIQGTVKLTVDQAVCNACRQGLATSTPAGIIRQFSEQFPSVRLLLTNTETGEILIIQGGRILG